MEKTYKILKILIWVLLFAVLIVGAYVLYNQLAAGMEPQSLVTMAPQGAAPGESAPEETQERKTLAPDFTAYDLEGNAYKLSDFQGKPVILNFWASWCGPCKSEMPEFQKFYDTYGEQINFVVVNLTDGYQETKETASAYVEKQGYTFPVYYDTDVDGAQAYGINAVPVTYFIDAEGYLKAGVQGALNESRFQQGIDLLLE